MSADLEYVPADQPDRCPSFDPWGGGLQCTRRTHVDEHHRAGGIAWGAEDWAARRADPDLRLKTLGDRELIAEIQQLRTENAALRTQLGRSS